MSTYLGYSRKGLKRSISSYKWFRVFNKYGDKCSWKTVYVQDTEVCIGSFIHNGYVYVQEYKITKAQINRCFYKVSLLRLSNEFMNAIKE